MAVSSRALRKKLAPARQTEWRAKATLGRWTGDQTGRVALWIGLLVALLWAPQLISFGNRAAPQRTAWRFLPARAGLESLELKLLDARFVGRGIVKPRSVDRFAIVGIDQNSLGIIGQWPWPRSLHARLIDKLKAAGARVIVIDADFSDRQFLGDKGELSREDKALIAATRRAGNVVLPSLLNVSGGANNSVTYQLATPFVADERGNAGLDEQTLDLGLANLPADSDGHYRNYPFAAHIAGETLGGLAPLSCGIYQQLLSAQSSEKYQNALTRGAWPTRKENSVIVPRQTVRWAGQNAPQWEMMPLYYWGPGGTFPTYSYADVLQGYDAATLKARFGGRIVLVGATAVVLKDNFPSPAFHSVAGAAPTIPGVEIHATAMAMLLDGTYLYPPRAWISWVSLFGLTLFCALWTERVRARVSRWARAAQNSWSARGRTGRIYDAVWFGLYAGVAALPLLAYWWICVAAFRAANLWIIATFPIGAGAVASGLVLMFLFTQESSGRRKVVQQLGLYMDSQVVEEILAHPEEEYPRPRRTQASVLFTDIEGFTAFSEAHEAEEVVAALNAFFSRLKPVVTAHGGSIDKFVGDAMMCFFGVPIPRADHARHALRCAIGLQEECARFRYETGIPFRIRIGLHTGSLIVGSIGSQASNGGTAHMNYTVIGDTVNLASRLEGKNKDFGSWILCSRAVGEAAPDAAQFRGARTHLDGINGEVEVLIVTGTADRPLRARVWGALSPSDIEWAEVALQNGDEMPELNADQHVLQATNFADKIVGSGRVFDSD